MKTYRNVRLLAVLLTGGLLAVQFAGCDNTGPFDVNNNRFSAEEPFSFQLNPTDQTHLIVRAINGSVEIIGTSDSAHVEVSGVRIVQAGSQRDAENYLARLDVNIRMNTGEIEVETEQPSDTNGREFIVNYQIRVPANWDVDLIHVNGEVEVDSLDGALDINHTNGNIVISDVTGDLYVDLTNGQISAKTANQQPRICRMTIVNGQMIVTIPESTDATFSASVTNGQVSVRNLTMDNLSSRLNAVSGTLGAGQGEITLRAVNGNIDVYGY